MQGQRNRIVAVNRGSGLTDLVVACALGMCQFDCGRGEMADAQMAANQQIDGVFGRLLGLGAQA